MFDSLHLLPMFALFALYCFMLLDDALWCLIKMLYLHIYLSLSRVYFTCICVYIYVNMLFIIIYYIIIRIIIRITIIITIIIIYVS